MSMAEELLRTLGDRLQTSASVRNVFGEPVTVGDRTIIPVARVAYGLGAGAGKRQDQGGGGGGGGVAATPVGMVEITSEGTRFIRFSLGKWRLASVAGAGFFLGVIAARNLRAR